jgi:hypothetical protein
VVGFPLGVDLPFIRGLADGVDNSWNSWVRSSTRLA